MRLLSILAAWLCLVGSAFGQAAFSAADVSSAQTTSPVSHTVPAGWAAGDLVIAYLRTNIRTVSSVPSGWTLIQSTTGISDNTYSYWKILVSGDLGASQSWTLNANPSACRIAFYRFTGAHAVTPIDASASQNDASSGTSHTSPSVTTTVDNCLIARMAINGGSAQSLSASSGDTGTQQYQDTTTALALFTSTKTTAGSTGTATYTTPSSRQLTFTTAAIAPAASSSARPQVIISQLLAPQRAWQRFVSFTPIALVQ